MDLLLVLVLAGARLVVMLGFGDVGISELMVEEGEAYTLYFRGVILMKREFGLIEISRA